MTNRIMENIWFIWQTNSDYADLLKRPEIQLDNREARRNEKRRLQILNKAALKWQKEDRK